MEQKAKAEWDKAHFGDSNPYAELPELSMIHNTKDTNYEGYQFIRKDVRSMATAYIDLTTLKCSRE